MLKPADSPLLSARDIVVEFGATRAVAGVDIEIGRGEVLGLLGANGAGKSTLMKVLAGVIAHGDYRGTIELDGREVTFASPAEAEAHGVGLVPQELLAVPERSVLDNLFLGRHPRRAGIVHTAAARDAGRRALDAVGADVELDDRMGRLSASRQQLVQIARALIVNPRVLMFDEPTSSLTLPEVEQLLATIRGLAEQGHGIVIVTHRLPEVFAVADRLQVLRDGRSISVCPAAAATPETVVDAMLGRELHELEERRREPAAGGEEVLVVDGLTTPPSAGRARLTDVSFTVRRGEIVGVFGLMGAGRTELLETLFAVGAAPVAGSVTLAGKPLAGSTARRIRAGVGLVTEDRKRTGLVLDMSVAQNTSMASLRRLSRRALVDREAERALARAYIEQLGVKTASEDAPVGSLSGGNQQKVVIAKWLATRPQLLLLDEPTRGVDVGAKADIFRILVELAEEGTSILLVTSEPAEAMSLCDRVLVMYRGRIAGQLAGEALSEEALMAMATGASEMVAAHER